MMSQVGVLVNFRYKSKSAPALKEAAPEAKMLRHFRKLRDITFCEGRCF